jgi:hypothetical protein
MGLFFDIKKREVSVNEKTPVAIFLDKEGGSHVGLIFWCEQAHAREKRPGDKRPDEFFHTRELHLLNDQFLKTFGVDFDNSAKQMLVAVIEAHDDDFNRVGALTSQLERLADKKGKDVALGPAWLSGVQYFDDDGTWLNGGGMVTCATFVREALLAFGLDIIDKDDWVKGDAANIEWKNGYIEMFQKAKISDERKAMLIASVNAFADSEVQRLLPSEMAYAASLDEEDHWPVKFDTANAGAFALREQYTTAFPPILKPVPITPQV